jgi:predicted Zn-dependent protease
MASAQNTNTAFGLASILLGRASQTTQQVLGTAANIGATAYFAKFSRQDESEADANAIPLMIATGYNPNGLTTMFQKLLQEQQSNPSVVEGWFSTHPTTQDRISATTAAINQIPASQRRNLTTDTNAFESFRSRMRSYRPAATQ